MMADIQEMLTLLEQAIATRQPVPAKLLKALISVGVDQTGVINPQASREQCIEIFMLKVKEKANKVREK